MRRRHFVLVTRRPLRISVSCRNSPMRAASASMSPLFRACSRRKRLRNNSRRSLTPHRSDSPMPNKADTVTMDAVYTAPGYLFRRMQQIAVAIFIEECKAFDLTPVQYAALIAIRTHPGIDATRLSAVIAFDRSTLGSVIERLEAKSYVERKPAPEDKRVQARILQPLKPADRKTLLTLLEQLVDLNNEASRVPLRVEDALEHLGKAS